MDDPHLLSCRLAEYLFLQKCGLLRADRQLLRSVHDCRLLRLTLPLRCAGSPQPEGIFSRNHAEAMDLAYTLASERLRRGTRDVEGTPERADMV